MTWKVAAASATGSGHAATGAPCQDAYHWESNDRWLIAVVCDGAGSARFSDVGARHATQSLCRELFSAIPSAGEDLPDRQTYWKKQIENAIERTRATLESKHVIENSSLRDFHATIVGVVLGPNFGTFFQVGDGAGVGVMGSDWENPVLALPENGEFSDQTFFYTEEHWREHLRFTSVPSDIGLVTLMTDGAMSFVMAPGQSGLDSKFIIPVTRYLDSVDAETGSQALHSTLDDPRTHAITTDDKTLLWARREL